MIAITTVTPNPSIDHTIVVDVLVPESVHRATSGSTEPSGKGINVALALHHAGVPAEAVFPAGGAAGAQIQDHLREHGLPVRVVPIRGEIRTNVTVVDAAGATTKFNEAGPTLDDQEAAALVAASTPAGPAPWVVWAGSLPPGFTISHLTAALTENRAAGHRVVLDSSGPAMRAALAGPREALPHLIKPNADELAELTGCALHTIGDVVRVARRLVQSGIEEILVSLGGDGAVLVTADGAWHGRAPVLRVVNTAGAGDALLAGYLAAASNSDPPPERLISALRFGADAVEQPGTLLLTHTPDRPVQIEPADPGRALQTPAIPVQEN